jgi:hypothetical protein
MSTETAFPVGLLTCFPDSGSRLPKYTSPPEGSADKVHFSAASFDFHFPQPAIGLTPLQQNSTGIPRCSVGFGLNAQKDLQSHGLEVIWNK